MKKQVFIQQMDSALARLKPEERKDILADFEDHFSIGMASGKSEDEVSRELGDPVVLAAQYTEGLPELKQPVTGGGVARGILAGFGLLMFNLMIAIPVIAALFAVWASLWSVVLSLLAASLACFVAPFVASWFTIGSAIVGIGVFLLGIALLALAVLAAIGMAYVTKWCYKGLVEYVKAHIRIIKGGSKE